MKKRLRLNLDDFGPVDVLSRKLFADEEAIETLKQQLPS